VIYVFIIRNLEDVEDLVLGATILGTGGGGSPVEGFKMLKEVIDRGLEIRVVDVDELQEDSVIVSPYYVGTIAPTAKTRKPIKISNAIREPL